MVSSASSESCEVSDIQCMCACLMHLAAVVLHIVPILSSVLSGARPDMYDAAEQNVFIYFFQMSSFKLLSSFVLHFDIYL